MNYKSAINGNGIVKIEDGGHRTFIPDSHPLYQDYLIWLSEGNVPEPADPELLPSKEILRSTIIERLEAIHKFDLAIETMEKPENIKLKYKWFSMNVINSDDPLVIAWLTALEIPPEQILY